MFFAATQKVQKIINMRTWRYVNELFFLFDKFNELFPKFVDSSAYLNLSLSQGSLSIRYFSS